MNMEILDIVIAGVIICLAGMAQSAVGFGYAMFATPLLVLIGLPVGHCMSKKNLRRIAYAILLVIGVSTVMQTFLAR